MWLMSNRVWASGYAECFSYTLQTGRSCWSCEEHNGFIAPFSESQLGQDEGRREKMLCGDVKKSYNI